MSHKGDPATACTGGGQARARMANVRTRLPAGAEGFSRNDGPQARIWRQFGNICKKNTII